MNTVAPPTLDRAKVTARIIARGSVLGRYEIVGSIGAGGMADVWLGRSTGNGGFARLLAIKTARPSLSGDPRLRAMFLREGALAVSPQNILVGLDGLACISDFGVANVLSDDGETTGTLRGKFAYFAPEQARREPLDRRADVFAMGVVLWEALTGARLFKGRDVVETLERVRGAPITDPRTHAPELPAPIAVVVMRALERDAAARHASAEAMADALASAAHEAGVVVDRRNVARTVNAVVALVAVVALGLRGRSAPVVNAPPLIPHELLVVRPARATVTPPPTAVPVSAPAPSSRKPPFE